MTTLDPALPRWDTTVFAPSVGHRVFTDAHERFAADVSRLTALYDQHGVGGCEPHPPTPAEGDVFDEVLRMTNQVVADQSVLSTYVFSFVATDSRDPLAQGTLSELKQLGATLRGLSARFTAWVAALGAEALSTVSVEAAEHLGSLRRLEVRADHQMSGPEEDLYAQLSVTGSSAWAQMHLDVTSQLQVAVELPDGTKTLPMAAVRGLATDADPRVRRAAFEAEQRAWPTVRVPLAAAMNAIKGEANLVNERRRWADPVAASQFANSVDARTFEAMQQAVTAALPDLRRWMRAKARLHGYAGGLRWWDLVAPLPMDSGRYDFATGTEQVREAFATYSRPLTSMAERAFDERWVDAAPRAGKVGGAFCSPFVGDRSLVLMNWSDSFDSVRTLAHELGHAYHNTQLAHRTALQRQLPMALAETASIFCETLVVEAGLAQATGTQRLALLDADLQGAAQVVVDIRSRFLFEQQVFAQRRQRTLSPDALCSLMTDAQTEAYGDGLDLSTAHPYMWAVKSHYYGSAFYNWPYTFGQLFGLGLHAVFVRDPDRFRAGYDDLLSRAGMAMAHELAEPFGIDTRDLAFWTASLDTVRARIVEYERLAAELTP